MQESKAEERFAGAGGMLPTQIVNLRIDERIKKLRSGIEECLSLESLSAPHKIMLSKLLPRILNDLEFQMRPGGCLHKLDRWLMPTVAELTLCESGLDAETVDAEDSLAQSSPADERLAKFIASDEPAILLTGNTASGKTVLACKVVLELCEALLRQLQEPREGSSTSIVLPIYIDLRYVRSELPHDLLLNWLTGDAPDIDRTYCLTRSEVNSLINEFNNNRTFGGSKFFVVFDGLSTFKNCLESDDAKVACSPELFCGAATDYVSRFRGKVQGLMTSKESLQPSSGEGIQRIGVVPFEADVLRSSLNDMIQIERRDKSPLLALSLVFQSCFELMQLDERLREMAGSFIFHKSFHQFLPGLRARYDNMHDVYAYELCEEFLRSYLSRQLKMLGPHLQKAIGLEGMDDIPARNEVLDWYIKYCGVLSISINGQNNKYINTASRERYQAMGLARWGEVGQSRCSLFAEDILEEYRQDEESESVGAKKYLISERVKLLENLLPIEITEGSLSKAKFQHEILGCFGAARLILSAITGEDGEEAFSRLLRRVPFWRVYDRESIKQCIHAGWCLFSQPLKNRAKQTLLSVVSASRGIYDCEKVGPASNAVSILALVESSLTGLDWSNVQIPAAFLESVDLSDTNLQGAELSHSVLNKAVLANVDLRCANLFGVSLTEVGSCRGLMIGGQAGLTEKSIELMNKHGYKKSKEVYLGYLTTPFDGQRIKRIGLCEIRKGDEISRGGFGVVNQGMYFEQDVAVKRTLVHVEYVNDDRKMTSDRHAELDRKRGGLIREALNVRALQHLRNVIKLIGVCDQLGHYIIVFERIKTSLGALIEKSGKALGDEFRLKILRGVAKGLKGIHSAGFAHLDLKPGNILVTEDGEVKLIDFGGIRPIKNVVDLYKMDTLAGTTESCRPKEISVDRLYGACTDIATFGQIMWNLRMGNPSTSELKGSYQAYHYFGIQRELAKVTYGADADETAPQDPYQDLMHRCWSDPKDRPTSAELVAILKSFDASVGIGDQPTGISDANIERKDEPKYTPTLDDSSPPISPHADGVGVRAGAGGPATG